MVLTPRPPLHRPDIEVQRDHGGDGEGETCREGTRFRRKATAYPILLPSPSPMKPIITAAAGRWRGVGGEEPLKTLLVLRHAKSDRGDRTLRDHDRPLAPRGEGDAPLMGTALAALDLIPDCILTSTATRARDTARLVAAAMGYGGEIIEDATLYAASVDALLDALRECDEEACVLLVGHNPGLEELICLLTGGDDAQTVVRLPTAALACLALDIEEWAEVHEACGHLAWLLTPRIVYPLLHAARDVAPPTTDPAGGVY
jgi:phosphohistidine phosphatase